MDEARYCVEILEGNRRKPIGTYTIYAFNDTHAEAAGLAKFQEVHPTRKLSLLTVRVTKLPD
jgi:hypothetical protein